MVCINRSRMWKSFKRRIGLKSMMCCGSISTQRTATTITVIEPPEDMEQDHNIGRETSENFDQLILQQHVSNVIFVGQNMSLAMALEAERNLRAARRIGGRGNVKTMRGLIEEADGVDMRIRRREKRKEDGQGRGIGREGRGGGGRCEGVCRVCKDRDKAAAFIPCGHTICRVCSRELWINRGSCPFCNRHIREILDIF